MGSGEELPGYEERRTGERIQTDERTDDIWMYRALSRKRAGEMRRLRTRKLVVHIAARCKSTSLAPRAVAAAMVRA